MPLFVSPRRIFMKIPLKDPESGEEAQTRGRPARDRGLPLPRVAFADDEEQEERKVGFIENTAMRHRGSGFREATVASKLTDR